MFFTFTLLINKSPVQFSCIYDEVHSLLAWGAKAWWGVPITVNSVVIGSAKNIDWWFFPVFLFINMSRITSGSVKKKKLEKNVFTTLQL